MNHHPPAAAQHGRSHLLSEDEVAVLAEPVEGWLSETQGRTLYRAACAVPGRGAIVEIGSWKGRSTIWLAAGARRAGTFVHAVDPHVGSKEDPSAQTYEAFRRNLEGAGLLDAVRPMVVTSTEAAALIPGPVELLFIDGDHGFEGVDRDAETWLPRLAEGGVVMFHDTSTTSYTGPRRVFQKRICLDRRFDSITRIGSMMCARRTRRRSLRAAVWAHVAWALLFLYDVKRRLRGR